MSLLPLLFDDAPVMRYRYDNDDDLFAIPRALQTYSRLNNVLRNLNAALQDNRDTGSQVIVDKNRFQANFDVQHFKPEEISVKVNENTVTIEGRHEEKPDEHGHISRHFIRKYVLPKNCDVSRVESKLSSDGVLSISAPIIGKEVENRSIPVIQTGKPARQIEKKEHGQGDKKK